MKPSTQTQIIFAGKPEKPFHFSRFLKQYGKQVLAIGCVLFLIATSISFFFLRTHYTAQGVLRVSPTHAVVLNQESSNDARYYESYVRTQVSRLKQYEVLMAALNRLPPAIKSQFIEEDMSLLEASVELLKQLSVQRTPGTHLIALTMKDRSPDGLAEMVNSIITVFLEKVAEEEEGVDNRRLSFLKQERRQVASKIVQQMTLVQKLSKEAGVAAFDEEQDPYLAKRDQFQESYIEAQARTLESQAALDHIHKEAVAIQQLPLDPLIEEQVVTHPLYSNTQMWTYSTLRGLNQSISGLAEDNPERSAVKEQIESISGELEELKKTIAEELKTVLLAKRNLAFQEQILKAEHFHKQSTEIEENLLAQLTEASNEVTERARLLTQGRQASEELDHLKDLHKTLEERIYQLSVESKAPGRISLETIARSIEERNLLRMLALCFLVSFGPALGWALFASYRDDRILAREDMECAIGSPPSWPIPYNQDKNIPFSRISLDTPQSTAAKAMRSFVVKLNKERCEHGAKIGLFTGIGRHAGTTRLALNCAHGMHELCESILLIDMNRQHPKLAEYAVGMPKKQTTTKTNTNTNTQAQKQTIVHDEERGIDILRQSDDFPLSQMSRKEVQQMLQELRQAYDFIILDTAPLLSSDLTEFLLLQSDIAVPIVAGGRSRYLEAYNAIRLMLRLEVTAIAPVLNWNPCSASFGRKTISFLPKKLRHAFLRKS